MVTARQGREIKRFKQKWELLDPVLQGLLIPHLLISVPSWRAWSLNDSTRLQWLERQFNEVDLSFTSNRPRRITGHEAEHGKAKRQQKVASRAV
jgi:hypothetical protein